MTSNRGSKRFAREVRVETYRDGEWTVMDEIPVVTLDTPMQGQRKLKAGSGEWEIEIPPPWRLYVDGELLARRGWE